MIRETLDALLSCLIAKPKLMDRCYLDTDDFEYRYDAELFGAMKSVFEETAGIDPILIREKMPDMQLDELFALRENGKFQTASFDHYQRRIREERITRETAAAARRIADNPEPQTIIAEADRISKIPVGEAEGPIQLGGIIEGLEQQIKNRCGAGGVTGAPGVSSEINEKTRGWQKKDLIVVGARPSIGKSAWMADDAQVVANAGFNALIFSAEMSAENLSEGMVAATASIDKSSIASGFLTRDDWKKYADAMEFIVDLPVYIDDKASMTVEHIVREATKFVQSHPAMDTVIYVDFLQFIGSERNFSSDRERVAYVTRTLKNMAKKLEVPVIALAALNRSVEQRNDKRPMMSDLRDAGDIESDADVVIFLYRDDYYNADTDKKSEDGQGSIMEFIIAKGRKIGTGIVEMIFIRRTGRFINYGQETKNEMQYARNIAAWRKKG